MSQYSNIDHRGREFARAFFIPMEHIHDNFKDDVSEVWDDFVGIWESLFQFFRTAIAFLFIYLVMIPMMLVCAPVIGCARMYTWKRDWKVWYFEKMDQATNPELWAKMAPAHEDSLMGQYKWMRQHLKMECRHSKKWPEKYAALPDFLDAIDKTFNELDK